MIKQMKDPVGNTRTRKILEGTSVPCGKYAMVISGPEHNAAM